MLLSAVMMLEYLGWNEAGKQITRALEDMFMNGIATSDLARFMEKGRALGTTEFSEELIKRL